MSDDGDHTTEPGRAAEFVRRVHEIPDETWSEVAGGTTWRTLFDSKITGTTVMSSGVAIVPSGGEWPMHSHPVAESYYYLEGEGLMGIGDESYPVSEGTSVMVPPGQRHGVINTGSGALRFFYVFPTDSLGDVSYTFD